jgi:hypothetical protein
MHTMKAYGVRGDITPVILNSRTRWKLVVIFMRRPLYVWGQRPRYQSNMRLGGAQEWKNSLVVQYIG